ncbi:MAG: acyl carrier protein, partial [Desulfobacterales bacterium]|nr:acyl carrier protein [Desulfobacterales bacterium]
GDIDPDMPFTEMGMDSIIGVEWIKAVNDAIGTSVEAIKIYDYPTLREFEGFVAGQADAPPVSLPPLDTPAGTPASGPSKIVLDMPDSPGPGDVDVPENLNQDLRRTLTATLAEALYMDESDIDPDMPFTEMGMDSIIGVEWIKAVNDAIGTSVEAIKIYDYPTLREFEAFLAGQADAPPVSLPPLDTPAVVPENQSRTLPQNLNQTLTATLAEALYMDESDIDPDMPFTEMGMDSIIGVEWIKAVNDAFGMSVEAIQIYDYPTLREFEGFIAGQVDTGSGVSSVSSVSEAEIPPAPPETLEEILAQVQQGLLDVDQADKLLQALKID